MDQGGTGTAMGWPWQRVTARWVVLSFTHPYGGVGGNHGSAKQNSLIQNPNHKIWAFFSIPSSGMAEPGSQVIKHSYKDRAVSSCTSIYSSPTSIHFHIFKNTPM